MRVQQGGYIAEVTASGWACHSYNWTVRPGEHGRVLRDGNETTRELALAKAEQCILDLMVTDPIPVQST